jgi:serine protease Do
VSDKFPLSRLTSPKPLRLLAALGLGLTLALAPMSEAWARGAPESFADLADEISPSVVNITTSALVAAPTGNAPIVPEGSPFEDFFKDLLPPDGDGQNQETQREQALGSGFVISADGYIVTNNHVIEAADEIEIEFFDKKRLKAKLVGRDPKTDIALLKVESDQALPFVDFGDSDAMRVGDWGIVSARGRELSGSYDDFLQTDAAINKGNSGGPLFNMDGDVIGVNTAILSPTGGSIGIGFSMASNVVTKVVAQLKEFGETRRGWLGVRIQDVTPDVAEAMELSVAEGALITDVPDGPAKDAGLLAGDVITTFNGQAVTDVRDLTRTVADSPIGEAVPVVVLREGKEMTIDVTLGRRETAEGEAEVAEDKATPEAAPQEGEVLGMSLQALTPEMTADLGLDKDATGLVVTKVDAASDAGEKGIERGDVVVEAGQRPVTSLKDLNDRVSEAKEAGRKSLLLLVRRGGDPRFVALSLE